MSQATTHVRAGGFAWIAGAALFTFPSLFFQYLNATGSYHLADAAPQLAALVNGVAIMGAAFILSWGGEAAQKDISGPLALAALALIALLPEYSVEAYLAWNAGAHPNEPAEVAKLAANVTGSNRLLIGLGWSLVALTFWFRVRGGLVLPARLARDLAFLAVATFLVFLVIIFDGVPLILGVVLILVYVVYLVLSSREEVSEPDLAGPAETIGSLPKWWRRAAVLGMFVFAAGVIVASVEPFVHGLVATGRQFGIDEFYLIQWLAPLASESPEMVIALFYTARANPAAGITVLVSAGVNQLTVLIGSMPVIYSLSAGQIHSIHLQHRQVNEFLLTAALSLFAVVLMARRRFTPVHAIAMLLLFVLQLVFFHSTAHLIFSGMYIVLTVGLIIKDPWRVRLLLRYIVRMTQDVAGIFSRRQPSAAEEGQEAAHR
ncbi:MAG: hypothetical protein HY681_14555 [Chloroflexi bacterium]|nr:hypothetical protein [Chloroflexota bacterium]